MPTRKRQIWLVGGVVLALLLLLPPLLQQVSLFWSRSHYPRLVASYLTRTNVSGQWMVRIGVTNVGNVTAVRLPYCNWYWRSQRQTLNGGFRAGAHRLLPGQTDVLELVEPFASRTEPWRITCYYACDGMQTRVYEWQRDSVLPGSWISRLLPSYFTALPPPFEADPGWTDH